MINKVRRTIYYDFSRPFFVAFFIMLMGSLFISFFVEQYRNKVEKNQMQYFALTKSNRIVEAVVGLLYKAEALSALVIQGDGEIKEFERIAAILITDPAIKNVLIAPNGIVSKVYPKTSNENVRGYNLLGPGDGNHEAILAKETGRLTMGGPFTLVQGGMALVGRLPVFLGVEGKRTFWGLVSVTLAYPQALASVNLEDIDRLGYASEIWRISPDTGEKQIILSSRGSELVNPVERSFKLLNAQWVISIAPITKWYSNILLFVYLGVSIFISILVAIMAQNYFATKQMQHRMEEMAMQDTLTNLPNRRFLFKRLNQELEFCKKYDCEFALAYLDINKFKDINDIYGHSAGDAVLIETARRLQQCVGKKQIAARVGGDEFILLLTKQYDFKRVVEQVETAMDNPIYIDEKTSLAVSVSVGLACFPHDGDTVEELTGHADASMYGIKKKFRLASRKFSSYEPNHL